MHDRHQNRKQYFEEQITTTQQFVIPYIEQVVSIEQDMVVAEIGCGEGGNLKPFLDRGCQVIGIDLATNKINNAKAYFKDDPQHHRATFISRDIYEVEAGSLPPFDLVIMKDTIEHIPHQEKFLNKLKSFLSPGGKIFFAFPPWRMPFGGHQQICRSPFLSKLPYFHLLPKSLYKKALSMFGEKETTIEALMDIRTTGLSIQQFEQVITDSNYQVDQLNYYLINPNYQIKFGLSPKKLPFILNLPHLKDFFTTAVYCVVSRE